MKIKLSSYLLVVLCGFGSQIVCGQVPSSSPSPVPYDAIIAAQRMSTLKLAGLGGDHVSEMVSACRQAGEHADADTLFLATAAELHPNVRLSALLEIAKLPAHLQKRTFARILRDDTFWHMDPKSSFRSTENLVIQTRARTLIGKVLGRDLRQFSKDYRPDLMTQLSAEAGDFEPVLITPSAREQAAQDLLAP